MSEVSFDSVRVGDELPPIDRKITQKDINKFAVADLDYNPVHTDPDWMKATKKFGDEFFTGIWDIEENVGHGMLTMSWMSSLITDWVLEDGGFLTSIDATLIRPVRPGETVTCTGVVKKKHPVEEPRAAYDEKGKGSKLAKSPRELDKTSSYNYVTIEIEAKNQDEEIVGKGEAQVRLPK